MSSELGHDRREPLVFIHSLGLDAQMWAPQLEFFSRHFPVLTLDIPGHGSAPVTEGPATLDALCDAMLVTLDAASVNRFHLCGLSLGGQIALRLTLRLRDRVRSLAACATAARIGTRAGWQERIAQVERGGLGAIADVAMERFFSTGFRRREPATVEAQRRVLSATSSTAYIRCCEVLRDTDLTSEIASIRTPSLFIAGALDISTPPGQLQELADGVGGARMTTLNGAHLINLEAKDAFNEAVLEHTMKRRDT
ncbi:MAG: alpha/beta fold hydrolase [Myxococcota bacterium]